MKTPELGFSPKGLYIGGKWEESVKGKTFESINPANLDYLGELPLADEEDVNRAVIAAKEAFYDWSRMPIKERAGFLDALAEILQDKRDELGLMDCLDSGNTISGMKEDVDWSADTLRYFAGLIAEIKGETFSEKPGHLNFTRREPYGVVAKINPFNHPLRFCAEKSAAALAAGNTVVIKASEQAPLSSLRFAEICHEVLPPGVVNVLTGDTACGQAMVRHPDVRRVGVVGSVSTGIAIAKDAAEDLTHVTLELGGKNPIIIFSDVDPKEAASFAVKGMNMNRQGQSCSSTSRVFVHKNIHKEVIEELKILVEKLPVGLPWIESSEVGPIVSKLQYDKIMDFITSAGQEGATLVTGGCSPNDELLSNGFFIQPTVFSNVKPEMRIAREEIFGPVMSVFEWNDYENLLSIVNGLEYGLTAMIVTNNMKQAMETSERVEAGYIWINSNGRYLGAPYGGWKASGIGQEECFDELLSYTRIKNINMRW
ncbi:MAG TPA: aldehyde dehydrogenase family protein [Candidatus Lambdaproteobacteria bacterium]|jgi:betaine-aldehyde dehydrogenase|nr:aldehyde dehydrogenase family protein [Candidatus Lambdaproteobacteria bacterium]HIK58274.1 aldehyde dehydrogenase family protein [Nitrospinaceae bacterium]